jgi:hypothetical protein
MTAVLQGEVKAMVKSDVAERASEAVFQGRQENPRQAQTRRTMIQKKSLMTLLVGLELAPTVKVSLWTGVRHLRTRRILTMNQMKMLRLRVFYASDCVFWQGLSPLREAS